MNRDSLRGLLRNVGFALALVACSSDVPRTPPVQQDSSARRTLAEARAAQDANDAATARQKAAEAVDVLLTASSSDPSEEWIALVSELGGFARDAGELHASERALRAVLEVRMRTRPDDHPDVQWARGNLAATLYALGDLHGAEALFEKTLDVYSRTLPDDDAQLQLARQGLAGAKFALGDVHGARVLLEKVLDVRTRTLPAEHPELQVARQNVAATLSLLGDLQRARVLLEQVLEVDSRTLPDDHPDLQLVRRNLATTLQSLGDLEGARRLQEKTLDVCSRTLPDEHPDLLAARQGMALTLRLLGDPERARALEASVLEIRSRTLPDDHPDLQVARLNYGVTIQALGDLEGARSQVQQALSAFARTLPNDHPYLQGARADLALILRELGDLQGARSLFEQVLDVCSRTLPDDHPQLQGARLNLALTIKELGELEGVRELEERVLEVWSRTLPDDHPDLQAARGNLALTLRSLGDLERARSLFEEVLEVRSRTLPEDHSDVLRARGNLALTLRSLGDHQGARTLLQEVFEIAARTLPETHPDRQLARLNLLISMAHLRGEGRAFSELAHEFIVAVGKDAQSAVLEVGVREAEERCARRLTDLSWSLSFAAGLGAFPPDADLDRAAFIAGEWTRGTILATSARHGAARTDATFEESRRALQTASSDLAQLTQSGATPDAFTAARERREDAERALLRLAGLRTGGAESLFAADVSSLSATLGESDAIVAYRRYTSFAVDVANEGREVESECLCAFVVRSDDRLERVELGSIATVERLVGEWRRSIGVNGESEADSVAAVGESTRGVGARLPPAGGDPGAAANLRRRLFDPLRGALEGAHRLIVCPDDVVCLVPLDALPDADGRADGHDVLGDRLRIETRTAVLELLVPDRAIASQGALVALGAPAFDGEPALAHVARDVGILRGSAWEAGFSELPNTRAEVLGIAAHFQNRFGAGAELHVLERAHASRESLFELAPQARFLHVATHGWFAPESIPSWSDARPLDARSGWGVRLDIEEQVRGMSPMLLCGLALAGANLPANATGAIRGLVTAEELSTLELSNCELAVLSACETSVGVRRAGQGVASLQRALQMAGARSVITSLWKVPDEATKDLMLEFYRRLWAAKRPKWQALWEAKTKLRDAKDERGKPKYTTRDWAAWVLTGQPE